MGNFSVKIRFVSYPDMDVFRMMELFAFPWETPFKKFLASNNNNNNDNNNNNNINKNTQR